MGNWRVTPGSFSPLSDSLDAVALCCVCLSLRLQRIYAGGSDSFCGQGSLPARTSMPPDLACFAIDASNPTGLLAPDGLVYVALTKSGLQ